MCQLGHQCQSTHLSGGLVGGNCVMGILQLLGQQRDVAEGRISTADGHVQGILAHHLCLSEHIHLLLSCYHIIQQTHQELLLNCVLRSIGKSISIKPAAAWQPLRGMPPGP